MSGQPRPPEDRSVFINAPFDPEYRPLQEAIIFTVLHCGFEPRSAWENLGSGRQRFNRLVDLIGECPLAIHDLSRTEPNPQGFPRFNMPFELGLFVGAREFGGESHCAKDYMIFERRKGQAKQSCTDLGGVDPMSHSGRPGKAAEHVRTWLSGHTDGGLPSTKAILKDYDSFKTDLPVLLAQWHIEADDISFLDFRKAVREWLATRD